MNKIMHSTIPLIELKNIEKVFLTDEVETPALSAVGFEIYHGEFISIAAPIGCGKSTLLAIVAVAKGFVDFSIAFQ
jgi:putative ABC transport system ATP-binding protein